MNIKKTWLVGLFGALLVGVSPMIGCENETEEPLPGGGEIEREADGETEVEGAAGGETEIEPEGDSIDVEQEAP